MLTAYPALLLVVMLVITLVALPYLDERRPRRDEMRREEMHVRRDIQAKHAIHLK